MRPSRPASSRLLSLAYAKVRKTAAKPHKKEPKRFHAATAPNFGTSFHAIRTAKLCLTAFLSLIATLNWGASVSGSNSANITIPDNGGWISSTITINSAPPGATVTGIDVSFTCIHTYSGDLRVDLNADAQGSLGNFNLWDQEGAGADNPSRSESGVNTFNGLSVNRTWYLYARDYAADDEGYITHWSITIYYEDSVPTPTISGVSPASFEDTSSRVIAVNGGQIHEDATLQFSPPTGSDINSTASKLTYVSSSQLTYDINTGGDTGTWAVRIVNPGNRVSPWQNFTVTDSVPTPTISGVSPASFEDTSSRVIAVNGGQIHEDATLQFSPPTGSDINSTASKLTYVSSSQLTYDINTGGDTGTWAVRIVNPGNRVSPWQNFTVTDSVPTPTISGVSPASFEDTSSRVIAVNGGQIHEDATLQFSPPTGSDINSTASKLTYVSSSQLTYDINTGGDTGTWAVRIVNPGNRVSPWQNFTVTDSVPTPTISGVSPASFEDTSSRVIAVNGGQIHEDATLQFSPPTGSDINSTASKLTYVSSSQLTYDINTGGDTGTWAVRIVNPGNRVSPWQNFTVTDSVPTLCDLSFINPQSITPAQGTAGNAVSIQYTIRNNGPANAGSTQTKIQLKNSTGNQVASQLYSEPGLSSGESRTQNRSFDIPTGLPAGSYVAFVILDNYDALTQSSSGNDYSPPIAFLLTAEPVIDQRADLAVLAPPTVDETVVEAGDTLTAGVTVVNLGQSESPAVSAVIELRDGANHVISQVTVNVPVLAAGQSTPPISGDIHVPEDAPAGTYSLKCVLQAYRVNQSNTGNDFSPVRNIFIGTTTPPDASNLIPGIDVSRHQGDIDWEDVSAAGIRFVYIKASEGGYPIHPAYFNENWLDAKKSGLNVGSYHFATPLRSPEWHSSQWSEPPRSAKDEAAEFVGAAAPVLKAGYLPPALDIEPHAVSYIETSPGVWAVDPAVGMLDPLQLMGAQSLASWIRDWAMEVERLSGLRPILYLSRTYADALAAHLKSDYDLWIAAPSDPQGAPTATAWNSWLIHQHSHQGSISGISGDVDLNVIQGPLSDHLIPNACLSQRGRIKVNGLTVSLEVSGLECQRVILQGTPNLGSAWIDLAEIQLVNGFAEVVLEADVSHYYFRVKPANVSPPNGALPATRFDYPIGNRGLTTGGSPMPGGIPEFPAGGISETNDVYHLNPVASPTQRADNVSGNGWFNIQDVGCYYDALNGIHAGEDWNKAGGDAGEPVYAVANGIVMDITRLNLTSGITSGGFAMVIRHWLPDGRVVDSVYVHIAPGLLSDGTTPNNSGALANAEESHFVFQEGDTVQRGQQIGVIGSVTSYPPHLHFELRDKPIRDLPVEPASSATQGKYWPNGNINAYYGSPSSSSSMTAEEVNAAYQLMRRDGIIDPSDFIDAHRQ